MRSYGLKELVFAGVENILGCKEEELIKKPKEEIKKWLEICFELSRDEKLLGTSEHYLYIGKK